MADIKYGSTGAGFADTIARMRAEAAAIAELTAKETERSAAEERDTDATQENAAARTRTASAVDALVDTIGRSIEALQAETVEIKANTEAWAQNAAARGRAIGAGELGAGGVATPGGAARGTRAQEPELPPLITFPGEEGDGAAPAPRRRPPRAAPAAGAGSSDLATVAQRNSEALAQQAERQAAVNDLSNQSAAAYAASSQALQRHGALTSEFFEGLARGEVTLKEFESQMVITLGKFSGWAVAGGLVYGAFEAVKNVAKGIEATQSGVSQLKRSLGENINVPEAEAGFRKVSQEVNVPIDKVAEAQFYAARAFPNQKDSLSVAGTAVRAEKLDEVPVQEAVKSFGALNVEFGLSAAGIKTIFDELDAGQLKFNARLNQTLPQLGRAAASFANAGGTPTQLVQQIIELNRATGGGGGQGGGNPATFLIREPGNLAKPATEEVLRQYGFDPQHAQKNIGSFNEEVQARARESTSTGGKLGKRELQEIAEAIGGGTANGLRYGLPLLEAGRSGLAQSVQREVNPQASRGSAEEDLRHKLEQLNEQGKKAGITLQAVGSELASIGVGPALGDAAHVLNTVLSGVELLTEGLVKLVSPLTELPSPLRETVEATLAFKGAQLALRSGPGLTASSFANQAGLTFLGGGSKELTAVTATQRSYTKYLQNEQEKLSNAALLASSRAKLAGTQVSNFSESPEVLGGLSEEERGAYEGQLSTLLKKEANTAEAQVTASEAQLAQKEILLRAEAELTLLTNKRLSVEERLTAASESGLYAAQLGAPNTLPILAPNASAAAAAEARRPGLQNVPVVTGAGAATAAETAAASVEEEAALGATAISGVGSRLGAATGAVKDVATSLPTLAARLGSFITGLGPLGTAVAAFVGLDLFDKVTGGSKRFEEGLAALTAIEGEITSEQNAISKIQKARKEASGTGGKLVLPHGGSPLEIAGAGLHNLSEVGTGLLQFAKHPIQGVEATFNEGAHPGTFTSSQPIRAQELLKKYEKELKEGKFKGLGEDKPLPEGALIKSNSEIEDAFAGLNPEKGTADNEKAAGQISKKVKLLFDNLKLFGTGGAGKQSLHLLESGYGTALSSATSTGGENEIDEVSKLIEEGTKELGTVIEREVKRKDKLATSVKGRDAVAAQARQTLSEGYQREVTEPLKKSEESIAGTEDNVKDYAAALSKKPGGSKETSLKKSLEAYKKQLAQEKVAQEKLKEAGKGFKEGQEEIEEAVGKETYTKDLDQLKGQSGLAEAKAGGNKQQANTIQLKEYKAELQSAESNLKGDERTNTVAELKAQIIKTEQAQGGLALALIKSKGGIREAQVPNQEPVQTAIAALKTAEEELKEISTHRKDFSNEEFLDAVAAELKAKKAAEEAASEEALKVSQFHTQLAQAHSEGNPLAQAQEGLAGAHQELTKAKGPEETRTALLNIAKEENAIAKAVREKISTEGEYVKSLTNNPVKKAADEVRTDKQLLAKAQGPEEKLKDESTLNNAKQSYKQELVSNRLREISFQEEMREISKQQAIQQIEDLEKVHGLAKATQEELRSKVRNLEKGASNNTVFDLAPGSIKLPTAYDVHRAAGEAIARSSAGSALVSGASGLPTVVRQSNQITVIVHDSRDVHKVGEEIDRVTGSGLHTRLRKAGIRGN